jgi:hypothetical protein
MYSLTEYSTTIRECAETKEEDILKLEHTCQEEYHNMSWYYDTHNPENIHNFCKYVILLPINHSLYVFM